MLTDGLILPGSIAIYSCDVGLVPDRSRFRECTADLTWSGIPPACIQGKIMWVNFLLIYVLPSGAEGIVESLSNKFIIGLPSLSVYTSQYLIVTTNGQRVPFIVLGNQFDSISNVEYTYNRYIVIPSSHIGTGIHIKAKANGKISVQSWLDYGFLYYSIDSFLAISVRPMDDVKKYEYYSIPYNYSSLLHLVATEDNTIVNLGSSSISLDRLQTHQINNIASLTSIRVSSDKPLSVISSKNCFDIGFVNVQSCDYLSEQLLPTHLWGRRFLVASFLGLKNGESLRILASKFPTTVTIACAGSSIPRVVILFSRLGQWRDVKLDEQPGGVRDRFCVVEATNPVYIIQFARVSVGDSYMMTIPAVEQYGEFFTGFDVPNLSPFNFVNIYVTPEHFFPGGILVDGDAVLGWTTVRCHSGEICGHISRPVLMRQDHYHIIRHQDPRGRIGISAYGFDTAENSSYGYPASMYIPSPQSK